MALFKIFKGNDSAKITDSTVSGYRMPTDGYAYYDTSTKLFYIDADYNDNGTITRSPINAGTAIKLATARSLKTKLDSTTAVTFDGSADQNAIPVTGTLPIAQGGTSATTAAGARANLATPAMTTESYPALLPTNGTNDWIKIGTTNTSYGLLPSQSGGAGSGHNFIGTSSWYWKNAYIDEMHGHLNGPADALNFVHTNELILGNNTSQSRVWFNYRRIKDGATSGNTAITEYRFGNGNAGTSGVTLYAANFTGNAATATLPLGFSSQSTNATWGNTTGTTVTAWNDSSGGSIDFRKDNPSSGKLSIKVDGRFYGNEGTYPAMLMNYNNGYWGLGSDPDGGYSGWVRAPASGILTSAKNASSVGSGVGAIGAIEWRFAHVYADTLHGNAETATTGKYLWSGSANPVYGTNRLEYFNATGTAATPTANATAFPTSDWYHFIRMNHGNSQGYYVEIASCFHNNNMYWRRTAAGTAYPWCHVWLQGNSVTGAVWNDYAEYREATPDSTTPGYVVFENGDDTLSLTTERLQHFAGITSDTWGFAQGETEKAKTPIAVSGRVLAYTYRDRNDYKPGDCVCAAPGGTIDIMTREEIREWPDRIVGTVSCVPEYDEWGGGELADRPPVKVNGRIWIKVR